MPPKNRRTKLEDLETEELEAHMVILNKKQITTKNAFEFDVIDCEKEIVQRTDFSQSTNTKANTLSLKNHASNLDICGRVYAQRVENTHRAVLDLSEDLQRTQAGKAIKGKKRATGESDAEDDGQGTARDQDREAGSGIADNSPQNARKTQKKVKNRATHIVDDAKKLACPETDTNANLISRFWSLIGNVQPGAMKNTWIHCGERLEDTSHVQYVMNPDFTSLQRYNGMRRCGNTARDGRQLKKLDGKERKSLDEAQEKFATTLTDLFRQRGKKGNKLEECVSFSKDLDKRLKQAAENAAKKQPRNRAPGFRTTDIEKQLERTCRQVVQNGRLVHPEDQGTLFLDFDFDSTVDDSVRPQSPADETYGESEEPSPEQTIENETANETDNPDPTALTDSAADTPRSETPLTEDPNQNVDESLQPDESSDFRKPRTPSVSRQSRASSILSTSQRSSRGRYGSVMREINEQAGISQTAQSESGSVGRNKKCSDWPETFEFSSNDAGECYKKMAKTNARINIPHRDGQDSLADYSLKTMTPNTAMQFIKHPAAFRLDNIGETLNVLTKEFLTKCREKDWLKLDSKSPINIDELSEAFALAYYEDFDKDRLEQQWSKQEPENYDLISDDESDPEDNDDGAEFEDAAMSFLNDDQDRISGNSPGKEPSPTPLFPVLPEPDLANSTPLGQSELNDPVEDLGPGLESSVEPGSSGTMPGKSVDIAWADLHAGGTRDLVGMTGESSPQEDAAAFAENIALKDLTGSGVNIGRMKTGVMQTYKYLLKLREQVRSKLLKAAGYDAKSSSAASTSKAPTLPYLTIQDVIDVVPFHVDPKDLTHVNASVVLSCLLHLAYEHHPTKDQQKLYLCNSRDLKSLYVMTREEWTDYSARQAHLNRLTDNYMQYLLNTQSAPAVIETTQSSTKDVPHGVVLNDAMSVLSVSDSDGSDEEGSHASRRIMAAGDLSNSDEME